MSYSSLSPRHRDLSGKVSSSALFSFDRCLLLSVIGLAALGIMMVASSSIVISEKLYGQPFHYLIRQSCYLVVGLLLGLAVIRVELRQWQQTSGFLLLVALCLLVLVVIPGIGKSVNGSFRWIGVGPIRLQVSEFAKFAMVLYVSSYICRKETEIKTVLGFIKPLLVLFVICFLLLLEPDFGAAAVISLMTLTLLFLSGVRLSQFFLLVFMVLIAATVLAVTSPYRLSRLTAFLSPWANQFDGGYQLTQSLIAFGRGGIFGSGLGASVQKLFYLPEAHTDFLFAVLAEELGLVGIVIVLFLYFLLVLRGFLIAKRAKELGMLYHSYVSFGITLWLGVQAMINIGVNSGLLPTKGLTLPLMSSGGSSMLMTCVAIAILFRIDYEYRWTIINHGPVTKKRGMTRGY
jgi:cell division protein FtsW